MNVLNEVKHIHKIDDELRKKERSKENYARYTFDDMVGDSKSVTKSIDLAKKVAKTNSTSVISLSWSTLNNLDCKYREASPISSKNIVPLCAFLNKPIFPPFLAPVKAPSSYPNSSLSIKFSGIAAKLIAING